MTSIYSINNQSVLDLCLQTYGTPDLLVKFCEDNGITDLNYCPSSPTLFVYDETLVTDQKKSGYIYVTNASDTDIETSYLITEDGTGILLTEDSTGYLIPE